MFNTRLASSGNEYATWADSTEIYTRRDQQELNEVRSAVGRGLRPVRPWLHEDRLRPIRPWIDGLLPDRVPRGKPSR